MIAPPPRKPFWRDQMHLASNGNGSMHIACAIARSFGSKNVTAKMLRDKFGMSYATSFRWQRAWRDANGVL